MTMNKEQFLKAMSDYKYEIETEIVKFFFEREKDGMNREYDLLLRFVINGGKRIRPIVMMVTYKGFGGKKDILRESLSIEFLHNALLIEDDFMDEDESRRGKPTVYKAFKDSFLRRVGEHKYKGSLFDRESAKFAVSNAAIMGNTLYALGIGCLDGSKISSERKCRALSIMNDSFLKVNEGQFYDLLFERKKSVSEEEYLRMVRLKSACIVEAAAEIGGVFAGAKKSQIEAIRDFIRDIIIAFQIHDDLMDINPKMKKGHEIGSDIRQGKKTLVMIKALEFAKSSDKSLLLKVLGKKRASEKEVLRAIKILYRTHAVKYCRDAALKKVESAKRSLKMAGLNSESEEFFSHLADFVINRDV